MTTTNSTTKLTKRDHFNTLLTIEEVKSNPALVDFINNELNLLAKKNSADKKPTATQALNEELKTAILEYMKPGEKYTVSMFIKEEIGYLDIWEIACDVAETFPAEPVTCVEDVLAVDAAARFYVKQKFLK